MKNTAGLSILLAGAFVLFSGVTESYAQARRVAAPHTGAGKSPLIIRKMESTGSAAKVRTPEIRNDASEPTSNPRDWARIFVQYETEDEWIDEAEFRYSVLVKHPKTGAHVMFPASVTYIDIPKGKRHNSTMFLRPNTLARYGEVEWAGVKVYIKGEQVASAQMPDDMRPWTANIKTMEGFLLNRSQTPFALVAMDNYETIKPR